MNGNPQAPEIQGIDAIVGVYRQTLPSIALSGPTFFAPLLNQFKNYVMQFEGKFTYQILELLTDGQIMDMPATIDAIVELSKLPCSIIIIGVGPADFSSME